VVADTIHAPVGMQYPGLDGDGEATAEPVRNL
jgi:hypothetical protein